MTSELILLVITVLTALAFDFLNGFHDAANSIATIVSTRVLSPKLAVLWAAVFNFLAAFFLGTAVAKTIGKGMIHAGRIRHRVVWSFQGDYCCAHFRMDIAKDIAHARMIEAHGSRCARLI